MGAADGGWEGIGERPLLILVGVTGVGKTTTVRAMEAAGLSFTLLPNRRALTDELIIGEMQAAAGEPIEPVTDRVKRFAYTAQYREKYAGGMAQALSQLVVHREKVPTERLVFDGVRGVNEVEAAAELLPRAYFLVLEAPLRVRVKRLLGRGDEFDRVSGIEKRGGNNLASMMPEAAGLFMAAEETELMNLVADGVISAADLQTKLKIVLTERENYDPDGAREALLNIAPERVILGDTVRFSPAEIATLVRQQWE